MLPAATQGAGVLSTFKNLKGLRAIVFASVVAPLFLSAITVFLVIQQPRLWLFYLAMLVVALALGAFNLWLPVFLAWRLHKQFPGEYSFDEKVSMFLSPSPSDVSDQFRWALARKRGLSNILFWVSSIAFIILFTVLLVRGVFFPKDLNRDNNRRAGGDAVIVKVVARAEISIREARQRL